MKKVILLLILLTGCNNEGREINLILYKEEDPFVKVFSNEIISEMDKDVIVYDSENSQLIQNNIIEELISDSKLLIINPVDRLSAYAIINKVKPSDVPIIFFNREPLERDMALWDKVYYVGANPEQSGRMQAELIIELFGDNKNQLNKYDRNNDNVIQTVILKGEQGHQDAEARTKYVIEEFGENGFQIEVLITSVANWEMNQAKDRMNEIFNEYENIELIISNNDAMALGAIDSIRELEIFTDDNNDGRLDLNDESWIPVVGVDGLKEAIIEIENGLMYGTIYNDSLTMAKAISELTDYILYKDNINFELIDGKYIWIDYKKFKIE